MTALQLTALDQKLLNWLETDESRFERYIAAHPEAADRIDQLLELGADAQRALTQAFATAVAAPIGLVERLTEKIGPGNDTSVGSVMLDMFGVGPATLATWLDL